MRILDYGLLDWLNGATPGAESAQTQIEEARKRTIALIQAAKNVLPLMESRSPEKIRRLVSLQGMVERYRGRAGVSHGDAEEGKLSFDFNPDHGRNSIASSEFFAFGALTRLINDGSLPLLRRCLYEKCQRWFLASRAGQQFCSSGQCRIRHWITTPKGKSKNAENQRKHYRWHGSPYKGEYRKHSLDWKRPRTKKKKTKRTNR